MNGVISAHSLAEFQAKMRAIDENPHLSPEYAAKVRRMTAPFEAAKRRLRAEEHDKRMAEIAAIETARIARQQRAALLMDLAPLRRTLTEDEKVRIVRACAARTRGVV